MEGQAGMIDLKRRYGDKYRIKKDECGDRLIPHRWGHFFAYSATELACFIKGSRKFNLIREQFPDIRVTQEGDQEIVFVFNPSLLPELAKALKASRKRQYSEETLNKLRENGRRAQKVLAERRLREKSEDLSPKDRLSMAVI